MALVGRSKIDLSGLQVVVMGLGRFGGGIGVTRWLAEQGARVKVTDQADEQALADSLNQLADLPLDLCLGRHDASLLDDCALLVKSPAVDRHRSEFFSAALKRGIAWSSEMNLFLERCPARIVGITGSAGKSTTTGMLGAILHEASSKPDWQHGRVWVGGNIGTSLLSDLDRIKPSDLVVLELSSFQLEDAGDLEFRPAIGLITNLRENHLDRHGTLHNYAAAKAQLFKNMIDEDALFLSQDLDRSLLSQLSSCRGEILGFGVGPDQTLVVDAPDQKTIELPVSLTVPGRHNLINAAGAAAVALRLGVDRDLLVDALARFTGLPHRLSLVAEVDGVRYFNDSKATSPAAAMTSIAAFEQKPIVIVGGSDKGVNFSEFGRFLAAKAKAVICTGTTAANIAEQILGSIANDADVVMAADLSEAVRHASERAEKGDVVLLAPGCPSYDTFQNYEQRGEAFAGAVRQLRGVSVS